MALNGGQPAPEPAPPRSVWDDEYLSMQERQPIGSPVELTKDEAAAILKEAVANSGE